MIGKAISIVWEYYKAMNSGPDGKGVSIKRNVAWGIATLMVYVEVYGVMAINNIVQHHLCAPDYFDVFRYFVYLIISLVCIDALMILLVLQITSVEKLKELATQFRPGILAHLPAAQQEAAPMPAKPVEQKEEVEP